MVRRVTLLAGVLVLVTCGPTTKPSDVVAEAAPQDWQQRVVSTIQTSEYRLRKTGDGFEAGNRAQGLRARWSETGLAVTSRTGDAPTVTLAVTSWGRATQQPLPVANWHDTEARADGAMDVDGVPLKRLSATRGELVEWWENRAEGLEHGFRLLKQPEGVGPVRVRVAVGGAAVAADGEGAVTLVTAAGQKLRYGSLSAWDATRKAVPAHMEVKRDGLEVVLDVTVR